MKPTLYAILLGALLTGCAGGLALPPDNSDEVRITWTMPGE